MGNRVDTRELVKALRICSDPEVITDCKPCPYYLRGGMRGCVDEAMGDAADRLVELVERCARYADEIIELRGTEKEAAG